MVVVNRNYQAGIYLTETDVHLSIRAFGGCCERIVKEVSKNRCHGEIVCFQMGKIAGDLTGDASLACQLCFII